MLALMSYFGQWAWWVDYWSYIGQLSRWEIYGLLVLAGVVLSYAAYHWLGLSGLIALFFIFILFFIAIKMDFYGFHLRQQYEKKERQEYLIKELSGKTWPLNRSLESWHFLI